jgi:hypothetical protein
MTFLLLFRCMEKNAIQFFEKEIIIFQHDYHYDELM